MPSICAVKFASCSCKNHGLFCGMVQSQGEPGYYEPMMSGHFFNGILGTLLLEQEYAAIEEMVYAGSKPRSCL